MRHRTVTQGKPLSPVDGEFRKSPQERELWCVREGHPLMFLNISQSTHDTDVYRCLCGQREEKKSQEAAAL